MAEFKVKREKFINDDIGVIEISSDEDGSPLTSIFCVKNRIDLKELEEIEDCFILEFDPFDSIDLSNKLSLDDDDDDVSEISVIYERGQVALRDYPHSRHLCAKFPFDKTPHENHCEQCYCYVCDTIAPCKNWEEPQLGHCHATANELIWKPLRKHRDQVPAAWEATLLP